MKTKDDRRKRKNILRTLSAAQLVFIEHILTATLNDISFLIFSGGTGIFDFDNFSSLNLELFYLLSPNFKSVS